MTLLAAFAVLLWRYSGQADISIGTPVAGRTQVETEGLIGFFVNTLVLRTEVRGEESFRELLQRVREVALGGYSHQEVPFEKLVEELQPERELSRSPLFQVMLVLQNTPREELKMGELRVQALELASETAMFDLMLVVDEREAGCKWEWRIGVRCSAPRVWRACCSTIGSCLKQPSPSRNASSRNCH